MKSVVFFDLLSSDQPTGNEHCDVCVVGAGAAGIYLAVQLAQKGEDVILVEAGGSICGDASEVGFEAHFSREPYPGATKGRFFGLGGSTSHWGGLLMPHTQHDLRKTTDMDDPWRSVVQTVSEKSDLVLKNLGYRHCGEFTRFAQEKLGSVCKSLNASGLDVAASLFLPFRSKNLAFLLNGKGSSTSRLRVFVNAVAKSWTIKPDATTGDARIQGLTAVARNASSVHITAKRFVIAAGAIESARILLELNSGASCPVVRSTAAVGCYLADHLSTSIADVAVSSLHDAARLFAPRFSHGWMRGFRFMESNPPSTAPRAFAHFIFDNENPGFILAKEALSALQGRRWPKVSCSEVMSGLGGLLALAHSRYWSSVLHIPPGTRTHLQLDTEQKPIRENRISLGSRKDRYGRQVADIHWSISDVDMSNIQKTAERILKKWMGSRGGLPALAPKNSGCDSTKPHDAYHPVGTCHMGKDLEAVVDRNLKVWGVTNLWVVSTGVLPHAGTANPTFTMLCLAETLTEHLTNSG